jgi:uncharacterized protein YrzB (UPF0473 family)
MNKMTWKLIDTTTPMDKTILLRKNFNNLDTPCIVIGEIITFRDKVCHLWRATYEETIKIYRERFANGWQNMDADHRKEFIRLSAEDGHEREYVSALKFTNVEGPDWNDLTQEQRASIRKLNTVHAQSMQSFGEAVASGDPVQLEEAGKKLTGTK